MSQLSFTDAEYGFKRKQTWREIFLAEMDRVVPWKKITQPTTIHELSFPLTCLKEVISFAQVP